MLQILLYFVHTHTHTHTHIPENGFLYTVASLYNNHLWKFSNSAQQRLCSVAGSTSCESKNITGKDKVHKWVRLGKTLRTTRKQDNKAKSYREVRGQEPERAVSCLESRLSRSPRPGKRLLQAEVRRS